MGLFKKIINQTRKPQGKLGTMMINGMNSGHAKLSDWGMAYLDRVEALTLLDIGCGGGRNVGELMQMYPNAKGTAIDYSELSVEKTREYNKKLVASGRLEVVQGDVSGLELSGDTYDLATAFETIYFWPGLVKCFSEVRKVLKDGGYFMIVNESDGKDNAGLKYEKIIDGMKCYTSEQIEEALKQVGFRKVRSVHHGSKPWITVIAKK